MSVSSVVPSGSVSSESQVAVEKKALDSQAKVAGELIQGATGGSVESREVPGKSNIGVG